MSNMKDLPKVSFGIVNCNRLFYLKSCLESLLLCTADYPNKEIIIVDNASVEDGTREYLEEKQKQGIKVIYQKFRDPSNEFACGLNAIVKESTGDYVVPLQGDVQFIMKGEWLHRYVKLYEKYPTLVGCLSLDAQRRITHTSHSFSDPVMIDEFGFMADYNRPISSGAGDVMYSRHVLEKLGPWSESNVRHEVSEDSETKMLKRIEDVYKGNENPPATIMPIHPVAIGIYTDARGTNARVRKNMRYGDYWEAKSNNCYYEIADGASLIEEKKCLGTIPLAIEDVAKPIGWHAPLDEVGSWKKNPINPDEATSDQYVILDDNQKPIEQSSISEPDYMQEWIDEEDA